MKRVLEIGNFSYYEISNFQKQKNSYCDSKLIPHPYKNFAKVIRNSLMAQQGTLGPLVSHNVPTWCCITKHSTSQARSNTYVLITHFVLRRQLPIASQSNSSALSGSVRSMTNPFSIFARVYLCKFQHATYSDYFLCTHFSINTLNHSNVTSVQI